MTAIRRSSFPKASSVVIQLFAGCVLLLAGTAFAATQYLNDGAQQNPATNGWSLPAQGFCLNQPSATTRPECLALRLNPVPNNSATCTGAGVLGAWATSGVCNDLVNNTSGACVATCSNPTYTDQPSCEESGANWIARRWNAAVGVCAIGMDDQDRNAVVCAADKGNWITSGTCVGVWAFPAASSYTPPLLNTTSAAGSSSSSAGPGPGDQCLRCHNSETLYNTTRVRDVEDTLYMGHRNMARKVVAGEPWGGPTLACTIPAAVTEDACEEAGGEWHPVSSYPSDDVGDPINWSLGQITIGGVPSQLYWIYGDWLVPLPRAIYAAGSSPSTHKPLNSYSCARCHTTGWTSDASINTAKEPEASFPGVTWDGVTNDTFGKVNLAGGVSGDSNKFASWDQFGIQCSRCHGSAVDNASNGGNRPFSAPSGMSTHHSNLTSADIPGSCSNGSFRDVLSCTGAGATWTYGYCTDTRFTNKAACEAGPEAAPAAGVGKWVTPCSNNNFGTQATCVGGGGTWTQPPSPSCSVAGACNNIAGGPYTDQASCSAAPVGNCPGGVACQWGAETDNVSCADAGGHYTGTLATRGQMITGLCMQCHRQETSGVPYADTGSGVGSGTSSHPGNYVKIGPYHSTVTFPSHPHGNMFLNSPHGQFTGNFNEIGTATFGNGYGSFFQNEGEASGTGNGCTGCHNVHRSTVDEAGIEESVKQCQECHAGPFAVDLTKINHLHTAGTPFDKAVSGNEEQGPCVTCHMPGGQHMFRINSDSGYATAPMPAAMTTVTNANTAPDGTFTNAVWVDLDAACGQCHGGGAAQATTTLTAPTSTASAVLTVASTTGFTVGQRITVADAGALDYDGQGGIINGDFETYILSITPPSTITVVGVVPSVVGAGKAVVQNPTKNGAPYFSKTRLGRVAKGMHGSSGISYPVTFSATPNGLSVAVDASVDCGSSPCPVFTYDWDWGDGTAHGSADPDSHAYSIAGTKTITLTVSMAGKLVGTSTRSVTLANPDLPPTVDGTCTWDANTWHMSLLDTSSDDGPDADAIPGDGNASLQIVVDFGDGSTKTIATQGASINHTYTRPGTFTVTQTAIDSKLQSATRTCPVQATPAYFSVSGTVKNKFGTATLANAVVSVLNGSNVVKSVYTAANGTFTAGSLKPAGYTLKVTKSGYTFTVPAASVTVGPSSLGNTINATNK